MHSQIKRYSDDYGNDGDAGGTYRTITNGWMDINSLQTFKRFRILQGDEVEVIRDQRADRGSASHRPDVPHTARKHSGRRRRPSVAERSRKSTNSVPYERQGMGHEANKRRHSERTAKR